MLPYSPYLHILFFSLEVSGFFFIFIFFIFTKEYLLKSDIFASMY